MGNSGDKESFNNLVADDFNKNKGKYTKSGHLAYTREVTGASVASDAMQLLQQTDPNLPEGLKISNIFFIHNPVLLAAFESHYQITSVRLQTDPRIFAKKSLKEGEVGCARVLEHFEAMTSRFPWNTEGKPPVIPCLSGTDQAIAGKVAETGWANISSLDVGFFGNGIYFTQSMTYLIPSIAFRKSPAIVLSWVLPGKPYPVIEAHDSVYSLTGAAIKNGYQSHYVLTDISGKIANEDIENPYCEIVIPQEAQCLPAIIYVLEPTSPLIQNHLENQNRAEKPKEEGLVKEEGGGEEGKKLKKEKKSKPAPKEGGETDGKEPKGEKPSKPQKPTEKPPKPTEKPPKGEKR